MKLLTTTIEDLRDLDYEYLKEHHNVLTTKEYMTLTASELHYIKEHFDIKFKIESETMYVILEEK